MQIADRKQPNGVTLETPPVIDYEGSGYRTDFWVGQGREYEDLTERLALQRLLPQTGGRIAEIGAGFGRLADLYQGYEQIILFDYSRTLLAQAVDRWGHDQRFVFVAGNLYQLPLAPDSLDSLVMVRVMHHLAQVPAALAQLTRAIHGQGAMVLEYANKRNLKAMARWVLGRQSWSPFDRAPYEFVALNFDFHPQWMAEELARAGLAEHTRFGVSHLRLAWLKRVVSARGLAKLDSFLFAPGGHFPLAPSVFVQLSPKGKQDLVQQNTKRTINGVSGLFYCPVCPDTQLNQEGAERVVCPDCGRIYGRSGLIWDFKEAIS